MMAEWHATPHSSNVAGFGYEDGVLTVEFKSGDRYTARVDEGHYHDMLRAPSVGSYVHRQLKGKLTPA